MKNHVRTLIITAAVCLTAWSGARAQAQERFKNRYSVGFGFTPEWQLGGFGDGKFSPSYGLSIDARFSRHSGIEFGLYERRASYTESIPYAGGTNPMYDTYKYAYSWLSLRLGYKFYSDILNFSVGFNADLVGAPKRGAIGYRDGKDRYGFYVTVSKEITLYKGLILEPEVHVNPFLSDQDKTVQTTDYEGTFLGLGAKLKYRF